MLSSNDLKYTDLAGEAYYKAALNYAKRSNYAKSTDLFKSAMPRLEKSGGASSSHYRSCLRDYAQTLRKSKRIAEAEQAEAQVKILDLQAAIESPRATSLPSTTANSAVAPAGTSSSWDMGIVGGQERRSSKQENESTRLVSRAEFVGDASMFSTLADVSATQKRYVEAEPLYKKMIEIDQQSLGSEHPTLAADLSNLALLYTSQGRFTEASPLVLKALDIYKKSYGENNLAVVDCRLSLANIFEKEGKAQEAERYYLDALSGSQKILGSGRFLTAKILNRLGFFYFKQSRYNEAEVIYVKALASSEEALGPNSRLVAACCQDYARVLRALSKTSEAAQLDNRAKDIFAVVGTGTF